MTAIGAVGRFSWGFIKGITSPVCATKSLKSYPLPITPGRIKIAAATIRGHSAQELGQNIGQLTFSLASFSLLIYLAPEIKDFIVSLAERDWGFWSKKQVVESMVQPEVFEQMSATDIADKAIPWKQYASYLLPFALSPIFGAANELFREKSQGETYSAWKTIYVATRFTLGTAVLVKLGAITRGMAYCSALAHELAGWGLYYGLFTVPTGFVRGLSAPKIDNIWRKQVFLATFLTSLGLAAITTVVNPALLWVINLGVNSDSINYLASMLTRGVWEGFFITQLVLRAEFGGDQFLANIPARFLQKK